MPATTCRMCATPIAQHDVGQARYYCSIRCRRAAEHAKARLARKVPLVDRDCACCGTPMRGVRWSKLHCSDRCRRLASRLRVAAERQQQPAKVAAQPVVAAHPLSSSWSAEEAAAIEAAIRANKLTRIENGEWRDELPAGHWRRRGQTRAA